jgi:hypothetical protein
VTVADVEPEALEVTANAGVALPLSANVCVNPGASSVRITVAVRPPAAKGANVAVIVQLALTA